jgi:hypothetical protein
VRKKKGCDDSTREVNEHDEEVRIAPPRPGSLTPCLGSNSEQPALCLFGKSFSPRRVTRVRVTCAPKSPRERVHHAHPSENNYGLVNLIVTIRHLGVTSDPLSSIAVLSPRAPSRNGAQPCVVADAAPNKKPNHHRYPLSKVVEASEVIFPIHSSGLRKLLSGRDSERGGAR